MTHGGSCQSPKRLSAVELGPPKVSSTNVPNRSHEFYYRDSSRELLLYSNDTDRIFLWALRSFSLQD
jgi:hypothetical protein